MNYKLLDVFINSRTKITIQCEVDHHPEFKITFDKFKNENRRCPYCSRKSYILFDDIMRDGKFKIMSKYPTTTIEDIKLECESGHLFTTNVSNFIRSKKCPICDSKCGKQYVLTIESQILNLGYLLLSKYEKQDIPIKIKCVNCGNISMTMWKILQRSHKCPGCYTKVYNSADSFEYKQLFFYDAGYLLLNEKEIEHSKCKYDILCPNGHIIHMNWGNFKHGKRCKICYYEKKRINTLLSYDYVKSEIEKIGYSLVSTSYESAITRMKMKCDRGHIYESSWSNFQQGHRCTSCNETLGEQAVRFYLENNKIEYISQHSFKDCLGDYRLLHYDFYLPQYNTIIEYDGEGHFKPVRFNGIPLELAIEKYERTIRYDEIKNVYCEKKNIKLIRISYEDFKNVSDILKLKIN